MTPWRFAKGLPVRGEPRPDLAPPSPLPPLRSHLRKPQRKTEQAAAPQTAPAGEQPAAATPEHTVFDRVAELEARVAELEAKERRLAEQEAKEAHRREVKNASYRRWRDRHLEQARQQSRERMRTSRARKRQGGT